MRLVISVTAALSVAITGASPAFAQPAQAPSAPARPTNGCNVFDPVDLAKLPKANPPKGQVITDELATRHADWHAAAGADAEIAVDSTDPMAGSRTTTLAERVGGGWRVSAVSDAGPRRDGQATAPQTRQVALDPAQTAALNAVLADACFWDTPRILPNAVPLKTGGQAMCFDGMNTAFRVRLGARRWYGEQQCRVVGLPGRLARILWSAALPAHFSGAYMNTEGPKTPAPKP